MSKKQFDVTMSSERGSKKTTVSANSCREAASKAAKQSWGQSSKSSGWPWSSYSCKPKKGFFGLF